MPAVRFGGRIPPGQFWLRISYGCNQLVAEPGTEAAGDGRAGSSLTPCRFRAFPRGLSTWISLGFLTGWWPQGGWHSHRVAQAPSVFHRRGGRRLQREAQASLLDERGVKVQGKHMEWETLLQTSLEITVGLVLVLTQDPPLYNQRPIPDRKSVV